MQGVYAQPSPYGYAGSPFGVGEEFSINGLQAMAPGYYNPNLISQMGSLGKSTNCLILLIGPAYGIPQWS